MSETPPKPNPDLPTKDEAIQGVERHLDENEQATPVGC